MKDDLIKAQKALIQFYLAVKIRKEDDADDITKEKLAEEEADIEHLQLVTLVNYIKSSIDTIITIKIEEEKRHSKNYLTEDNANAAQNYETLLRKEENEIRQHISIENQLKIHIEKITEENDELTKENAMLKKNAKTEKSEEQQIKEDKQLQSYRSEIENLEKIIKTYRDNEIQYELKEKKYKMQMIDKNKEIKRLESKLLARKSSSFVLVEKERDKLRDKEALSSNSSICSNLKSKHKTNDDRHNKNSARDISPIPIEKTQMIDKLEQYRKLIDKKVNDVTRNKPYIFREKSCASVSYNTKGKFDNEMSLLMPKSDSQRCNNSQKKINNKDYNVNVKANIIMKKIPISINNVTGKKCSLSNGKRNNNGNSNNPNSNNKYESIPILLNQSEMPSCNNTYYYQNKEESQKKNINQLNLRQFIFTKYGTSNLINKIKPHNKG